MTVEDVAARIQVLTLVRKDRVVESSYDDDAVSD